MKRILKTAGLLVLMALIFTAKPPASAHLSASPSITITTFETGKTPTVEIHVAPTGDDLTGDGSAANPYKTPARALQDAAPGTAIRLHSGTYADRINISDLHGTSENPIWIGGAPDETPPILTGATEAMHLSKVSYLILHDLEVQGTLTSQNGINADDGGEVDNPLATHHLIFRNLSIHHIGGTGNQDCLKLSGVNEYFVLNSSFGFCGGGISGSGIDHVGCHQGLIVGNTIHDTAGSGIQVKGGSEDIEIRANHFIDAGERSVNIGGSTGFAYFRPPLSTTDPNFESKNIRVIANLFEGSVAPLAFVGTVESLALNNTIINPDNWLIRILQETTTSGDIEFLPCGDNALINNLFYFDRSQLSTYLNIGPNTASDTFTFANNLWYAHDQPGNSQPNLPVTETNPIVGVDPLLFDPKGGNYHLQSASPAIGAGAEHASLTLDFDGNPYASPPTLGAFEYWDLPFDQFLPALNR